METVVSHHQARPLFDPPLVKRAIIDSFMKLNPRVQLRNPVMFTVFIGSILTSLLFVQAAVGKGEAPWGFILGVSLWFDGLGRLVLYHALRFPCLNLRRYQLVGFQHDSRSTRKM